MNMHGATGIGENDNVVPHNTYSGNAWVVADKTMWNVSSTSKFVAVDQLEDDFR